MPARKAPKKKVVIPKKRKTKRREMSDSDSDSDTDSDEPHEYTIDCCFYTIADDGRYLVRVEQEDDSREEYCTAVMDYVEKGFQLLLLYQGFTLMRA